MCRLTKRNLTEEKELFCLEHEHGKRGTYVVESFVACFAFLTGIVISRTFRRRLLRFCTWGLFAGRHVRHVRVVQVVGVLHHLRERVRVQGQKVLQQVSTIFSFLPGIGFFVVGRGTYVSDSKQFVSEYLYSASVVLFCQKLAAQALAEMRHRKSRLLTGSERSSCIILVTVFATTRSPISHRGETVFETRIVGRSYFGVRFCQN